MAGVAADALIDVDAVIEIDEVGQLVDPRPLQRLAGAVAVAHRLQHCALVQICEWQFMQVLVGGIPAKLEVFHRSVAVTAVDPQPGDMMLMAERHRLRLAHSCIRDVGRTLDLVGAQPKAATTNTAP